MRPGLSAAVLLAALLGGMARASPAPAAPAVPVHLCYENSDVAPWRFRDRSGLNFLMLEAVARESGVRFVYHARPWRRCQDDLRAGRMDGAFGMSYTPERASFAVYPGGLHPDPAQRMFEGGYVLVRRAGTPVHLEGGRIRDLSGPIGAEPSHSIALDLARAGYEVDDGSPGPEALLRKLKAGRLGAAAVGTDQAHNLRRDNPALFDGLEVLPVPLVEKPYFLVFSRPFVRSQPVLAERLWEAIATVRESPGYQAALAEARARQTPASAEPRP